MHKKRLYLVQACDKPDGFTTLPYSIGVLAAFAFQNETIRDTYELCDLIVDKVAIQQLHQQIREPDVVAFSCYIWNLEYSKQAAIYLKKIYPKCIIIFGGHSIPINQSRFLMDFPYVDYLIHGEGEIPFTTLLAALCRNDALVNVPNISYLDGLEIIYRYDPSVVTEDYPSPYLLGLFDKLTQDTDRKCVATLETNRGCPFHCAYCDWGLNRARLRRMDIEKIRQEINWMGKNHIFSCNGADSNFGLLERDEEIAAILAKTRKRYGYPKKFTVSFSKQSDERVLRISRTLQSAGLLSGVTLSFQSLNPATLRAIGRENLTLTHFKALMERYNRDGIPTYSEIILGLPEETYDSFASGICQLIECGQYRNINIYPLTLLPNSELGGISAIKEYGLQTLKAPLRPLYCKADSTSVEVREYSDIVVQTNSLTREDWAKCKSFASILKGFHTFGITLYISTFLSATTDISIREIYEELMEWIFETRAFDIYIRQHEWWAAVLHAQEPPAKSPDVYKGYRVPEDENAFLQITEDTNDLYRKLDSFWRRYAGPPCWGDLLAFQKIVFNYIYNGIPSGEKLNYDFVSFFNDLLRGRQGEPVPQKVCATANYLSALKLLPKRIVVSFS